MALTNYRDLSRSSTGIDAGFQFEFFARLRRYLEESVPALRTGQAAGILRRISSVLGEFYRVGAITDILGKVGRARAARRPRRAAIAPRRPRSKRRKACVPDRYNRCTSCHTIVCENCWNPGYAHVQQVRGRRTGCPLRFGRDGRCDPCVPQLPDAVARRPLLP